MAKTECTCSDTYINMAGPCLSCPLFQSVCQLGSGHNFPTDPNKDPDICTVCGYDRTEE